MSRKGKFSFGSGSSKRPETRAKRSFFFDFFRSKRGVPFGFLSSQGHWMPKPSASFL
jgi:hypothetical protein